MDEEERDRESREVGRSLISDSEFNELLRGLIDRYFEAGLTGNPTEIPTTLICYEAVPVDGKRKVVELTLPVNMKFTQESLTRVGKKIFDMGVAPVALYIVGFGQFHIERLDDIPKDAPGILIGGLTLDSRSATGHIELAMGSSQLIPVNKYYFPFKENPNRVSFNYLIWVYDGYSELMRQAEISMKLYEGLTSVGLWQTPL